MGATAQDLARAALTDALAVIAQFDLAQLAKLNPALHADVRRLQASVAAALAAPAYHVPGPYEIALQLGCALASAGTYATPGAALQAAWFAVPEYYAGRDAYLSDLVPALYPASPPEGADNAAESEG